MVIQEFTIEDYDWDVIVFYADKGYFIQPIMDALREAGTDEENMSVAKEFLERRSLDSGFTFSVPFTRRSVMFIGDTDSGEQFQSTYDHEKGHLAMHIAQYVGIDPFSEEFQYLVGEIGREMYRVSSFFLCDECRHKRLGLN